MRLALIPPYAHINAIGHTDYQLLLPQHISSPQYSRAYHKWRREGHFMILDNGAAEGVETTPQMLHEMAHFMMVNEIVIPDTMGDFADTVQQAREFEKYATHKFGYMAVVQGDKLESCYDCVHRFSQMPYIRSLGVPRHLITTISEEARIHVVGFIRRNFGERFNIHLLGTNPAFMNELVAFGRAYESYGVRGVDTSAPFNYALHGATLLDHESRIPRPDDYFERHINDTRLMYLNIALLKDWTYGLTYQR